MRLGFNLPQFGQSAGPDGLIAVARRVEEIGYDRLWVIERLLCPVEPRSPHPATADGSLQLSYRRSVAGRRLIGSRRVVVWDRCVCIGEARSAGGAC